MSTFFMRLLHGASSWPERELCVTPTARLTWADAASLVDRNARAMRARGVAAGSRVAIETDRFEEVFPGILAAWSLGANVAPINPKLSLDDRRAILTTYDPHHSLGRDLRAPSTSPAGDEPGLVMFTSGSTGVPKGVRLTEQQLAQNAAAVVAAVGLGSDERLFVNTPPVFMSSLCHFLAALTCGGTFIGELGFFFGADLLEALRAAGATSFGGAPVHLARAVAGTVPSQWPSNLRRWFCSGDHLPVDVLHQASDLAPHVSVVVMYGLTEVAGRLCLLNDAGRSAKAGSVGRELPGMQISVRDEQGRVVPDGVEGELWVDGPMLMRSYVGDVAPVRGAFRTGDIGRRDEGGFLWLVGRSDDVFKSSGEKVSLVRIEQELCRLDGVVEAVAVAVDDQFVGKRVEAFVVPTAGMTASRQTLIDALKARLPGTHIPKRITVVEALPRTGSGKVRRRACLEIEGLR